MVPEVRKKNDSGKKGFEFDYYFLSFSAYKEVVVTSFSKSMALFSITILITLASESGAQVKAGNKESSPIITENANPRLKKPISLRSNDASLAEILKILAERSGMNFVTGQGVHRERLSIILDNTPLDEAIDLVVRAAGLSYEIVGNSVLIAEASKLKGEVGQQGYVVALKHAKAEEVAEMLTDLTKSIKVDKGGNKLVCFTSPRAINEIERIVKSIDQPHPLVVLETRLVEVSLDKLSKYGITWQDLSSFKAKLSLPETKLGSDYSGDWVLNKFELNLGLDMLLQNGDARLLMDSKLTTTNNREASIHIGEIVPYLVQQPNINQPGIVTYQVEKEKVGIQMQMTPHINREGQVVLTIEPNVSNIAGWKGQSQDIPLIRTRQAKTTVRVNDGQTIFLAGLLSEDKTVEIRKLPILGQLPIIGLLFQNLKETVRKTNLIIEITPRIVQNGSTMGTRTGVSGDLDEFGGP